jgi:hypothetical protein
VAAITFVRTPPYRRRTLIPLLFNVVKRRPVLPALYDALFEVSAMRDAVTTLRSELEATETTRFLSRLENAELTALRLIDQVETQQGVSAH